MDLPHNPDRGANLLGWGFWGIVIGCWIAGPASLVIVGFLLGWAWSVFK